MAVHRIIEAHAARSGDSAAISDHQITLSYRELNQRANAVARHLIAHGFRRGGIATLCLPRCAETAIVLLGILKAGGTYLLIDCDANEGQWPHGVSLAESPELTKYEFSVDGHKFGRTVSHGAPELSEDHLPRDWTAFGWRGFLSKVKAHGTGLTLALQQLNALQAEAMTPYLARQTPLAVYMFRHTRATLRAYQERGLIHGLAVRRPEDVPVAFRTDQERTLYDRIDELCSQFYRLADLPPGERSGVGFLMFDARRAGSVVEILLGMIILGTLWYIVDSWILAPIEQATGQRWGLVTK